jgi:S1-C subfamily serine protease
MTSPDAPPLRPRPSRSFRGLAAITALVAGAALFGFATAPANAQSSGGLDVDAITEKVDPAVVDITSTLAGGQGRAAGTGMVISSSGEVLTNNHVIENATSIRVRVGSSGRSHSAEVLGYNAREDLALLKVNGVSDLETVATDTSVSVGESVVALGNGGGRGSTQDGTTGSVTAVGETITVGDATGGSQTLANLIRVDASLEAGDSGGPLVDSDGEVIGVNTAASSGRYRINAGSSTGYAIPIKTALSIAAQIESGQGSGDTHVGERAFLGVSVRNAGARSRLRGDNAGSSSRVTVAGVQSGSPADDAGIGEGSVLTTVAGKSIRSVDDITSALAPHHPGDKVEVGWTDASGDRHTATVTLASGPPT